MRGAERAPGLLVLLSLLLGPAAGACPPGCLCASDILSCGSQGLELLPPLMPASATCVDLSHNRLAHLDELAFAGLPRLDTLRLAHNHLARLVPGTFRNASALRHLDLSSNELHVLEQHDLQELLGLEELLLFNNRITRVESRALAGLSRLRRVYLSHNRLTDFPFFSIQEQSHPQLATLDLSSNRLSRLPLEDVASLPTAVQRGLFLHNNTLVCDCSLYSMFRHWERRGFGSVREYREEHTCLLFGERRASIRFFQHARFFENCTARSPWSPAELEASVKASAGDTVLLRCSTSLHGAHLSYQWVSPHQEYVAPPGNNASLRMHANGSLEIAGARVDDSGVYLCVVLDRLQLRNETLVVNVSVSPRHVQADAFNTGFTTLLGCVVSLLLVLIYLYLTPCRCCPRKAAAPPAASPANDCSAQSSILTPTPPATTEGPGRKAGTSKHVVFLEPIKEVQNGRLRAPLAPLCPEQPKLQQLRGDDDSVTSAFSDAPMVA